MADKKPLKFRGFVLPTTTPVPDQLFDELLDHLTGAEIKVLLYIIRRTYGFKKDQDNISLSQLIHGIKTRDGRVLDKGTGLAKSTVVAALRGLQEQNIIVAVRNRSRQNGDEPTTYALNILHPPRVRKSNRGGSKIEHGPVRKANTQQTALQQTGIQRNVVEKTFPSLGKERGKIGYLVGEIEKATGDTHSRRMFEIIANGLPDTVIFQLLSEIRQGEGIRNRGAVFVAAAKRWAKRRA
jgi:hypothetical protein